MAVKVQIFLRPQLTKILLLSITIISWGLWAFLQKIALQRLHPIQMLMIGCIVGCVLLPVYALALKQHNTPLSFHFGTALLVAVASLASAIGTVAYIYGIRSGELGTIAVLSCTYPVLTFILAVMFLGEAITVSKIIGILFVLFGVFVLGR